ncbi:MAG TPA: nuclear transport factor 2 family protein [Caulobacteraceae bacterium]
MTAVALIDRYIAAWNETDEDTRLDLIAGTWSETADYLDPLMTGQGHEGINAMIQGAQAQLPGFKFRLIGAVDTYADQVRFSWEAGPEGVPAPVAGSDFGRIGEDGRLTSVTGFIDRMPGA